MSTKNSPKNSSPTHSNDKKVNFPVIIGSVAAIIAVAIVGWNMSITESRSLYVVSGFEKPAIIQLPGMEAVGIAPGKVRTIRLAEGDYEATISGPITNTLKFSVRTSFMDRFTKKPAWVLNVGGSALLFSETIDPFGEQSEFTPYYGEPFVSWLNVDLPFTELPDKIQGKKSLTRIGLFKGPVIEALVAVARSAPPEEALNLAEWHLRLHRDDSRMLSEYVGFSQSINQGERLQKFLIEGTEVRPVEIDWHRAYQDLLLSPEQHGSLIAEYDGLLKKDPNNSSLLYLRGRLCISQRQALDYYNKSLMTSFNNAFTHFAMASAHAGSGEWQTANSSIRVARSLRPDILLFQNTLFETRLAMGDYEEMEGELLKAVQQVPLDITLNIFLGDVLAAAKKHDLAKQVCDAFESRWSQTYDQPPPKSLRSRILYSIGDFDTMVKLYAQDRNNDAQSAYFEALVELGRLEEALTISPIDDTGSADPFHFLAYATAWKLAGNEEKFQTCSKRAFEMLKSTRPDFALIADLLADNEAPDLSEVIDVPVQPKLKAIILVYLAAKFPANKSEYADMARKLNVERSYPFHLIAKVAGTETRADAK
ncbi:MAG: tetratricopeptide repeat protein [Verrucomicrobia bacterium]|nr:tetratricopeptide repeat protein [Verrucomicrobiota bacterium]